jgi:hypothetical protein
LTLDLDEKAPRLLLTEPLQLCSYAQEPHLR